MYYFDHAAGQPPNPEICDFYQTQMLENYANPSAPYRSALSLAKKLDEIRSDINHFLDAENDDQIIFTSSATESNNLLIKGLFQKSEALMAVSLAEHPSLVKPIDHWARQKLVLNHSSDGQLDIKNIENALEKADLLCLSHINNHTGVVQGLPHEKMKSKRAHVHWDLSQSVGKKSFSVKQKNADSVTLSGHKFGVPKGIGVLWLKRDHKISSLLEGGDQESGMRSSTVNFPLIATFHHVLMNFKNDTEVLWAEFKKRQIQLIQELKTISPDIEAPFLSETSSPYITTLIVPGPSSDILMRLLDEQGVVVTTHSACSSKNKKENEVMRHLGLDPKYHQQMIRLSFSPNTSDQEIQYLIKKWNEVQSTLKLFKKEKLS